MYQVEYRLVRCTSGLESRPTPQAEYGGSAGKKSPSLAGTRSCGTTDLQQYASLYRPHTTLTQTQTLHIYFNCIQFKVLAQWISGILLFLRFESQSTDHHVRPPLRTVLTLFNVNWEVFYELWIQPPVLSLRWFQSVLPCRLSGLVSFSRLLHQLTTSRFGCVCLQTPQGTLAADQICYGQIN